MFFNFESCLTSHDLRVFFHDFQALSRLSSDCAKRVKSWSSLMNPLTGLNLFYFNGPVPFSLEFFLIFTAFRRKECVLKVESEVFFSLIVRKSQINFLIYLGQLWCCTLYSLKGSTSIMYQLTKSNEIFSKPITILKGRLPKQSFVRTHFFSPLYTSSAFVNIIVKASSPVLDVRLTIHTFTKDLAALQCLDVSCDYWFAFWKGVTHSMHQLSFCTRNIFQKRWKTRLVYLFYEFSLNLLE